MFELTRWFLYVFGALAIVGGLIGFLKKGSKASLIAGGISGLLLLACAWYLPGMPTAAMGVALAISVLLAGRFVPAFLKTRAFMPAGLMSILSVIGIVLTVLHFAGVR